MLRFHCLPNKTYFTKFVVCCVVVTVYTIVLHSITKYKTFLHQCNRYFALAYHACDIQCALSFAAVFKTSH